MPGLVPQIPRFGRIDAESEQHLADYFLATDAYRRIEDQEHIVVSGRKGTGKTAIYKSLLERTGARYTNVHLTGLQFQNYPWGTHQEVSDEAAAPVERYAASWKFLILVELSKLALKDPKALTSDRAKQCASVLSKFIRTNWGQLDFRFSDIFRKREYSFKFEPMAFGTKLGALEMSKVPREQLAGVLREANAWIEIMLSSLLKTDDWYFVLFDDLDRGYDSNDEQYSARLIGLLLAARDVFHWAEDRRLLVGPIVFIRSDIYSSLSFPDKNKITQNLLETLTWTDQSDGENSLKSLIDQRIRAITETDIADPWNAVFSSQVMRGTQAKFKHIAARSYLRPRDMIEFCNLCVKEARTAKSDLIENNHIYQARPRYSEYLINELDDEIHEVAPDWRRYLDVLRSIHTLRFSRGTFDEAFQALNLDADSDEILEVLYRFSVIGFTKIGGALSGSAVTFRYKNPGVSFDPAAPYFNVHLGLKEALELVEAGE